MTNGRLRILASCCALAAAPLFFWSSASPAQTATPSADFDALVANIKNYYIDCHATSATDTGQMQKCTDEKNGLLDKQKALGVSNDAINNALNGGVALRGGWRWP
jgi:hypothetical protein